MSRGGLRKKKEKTSGWFKANPARVLTRLDIHTHSVSCWSSVTAQPKLRGAVMIWTSGGASEWILDFWFLIIWV